MYKKLLFFLLFCNFSIVAIAQNNTFTGTWVTENITAKKIGNLNLTLAIAEPYEEILYPALLKIKYENIEISYRLLLVKNSTGQLIIGQNKIAAGEFPFNLESSTELLSGHLNKIASGKNIYLLLKPLVAAEANFIPLKGMDSLSSTVSDINKLLSKKNYKFKKLNDLPWVSPSLKEIIEPDNIGNYYGLTDSLVTRDNNISLKLEAPLTNNKQFSASLNNQYLFEKEAPKNFNYTFKKVLKEGANLICFFADDFPLLIKDSAALMLSFDNKNYSLNFAESKNENAGFIIALIYYEPLFKEKPKEPTFTNSNDQLLRNTLLIDSLYTQQQELTFAIWDDALQDGDSISLSIKGKWILQNKLVTNSPQFFKIRVQAGANNIVFVANNLGSIPPNTSIIEIIDDRQRKAFNISTNLRQNNLVKIIYEVPK